MSEGKWTKGPWHYAGSGEVIGTDKRGIAYASVARMDHDDADGSFGEATANAHLIAASPDLYDALQGALTAIETVGECLGDMDAMRRALSRARGEQVQA